MAHKKKRARDSGRLRCDSHLMNIILDFECASLREDLMYEMEVERERLLLLIRKRLTTKQKKLLDDLLEGKSMQEISNEWESKYGTVQALKSRLLKKMKGILLHIKNSQKYDYTT